MGANPTKKLRLILSRNFFLFFLQAGSKSPTPSPSTSPIPKARNNRQPPKADKPDKPDIPPPPAGGAIKVPGRNSSLHGEESRPNLSKSINEFKKVVVSGGKGGSAAGGGGGGTNSLARPPKPDVAPPPFHPEGNVRRSVPPPTGRPRTPQVRQGKPTESLPLPTKKQPPRSPSPAVAVEVRGIPRH